MTAPETVTSMAAQSSSLRLSPRNRTAAGATKMGNVWTTGMVRDTSRLAMTRKNTTAFSPQKTPPARAQPVASTVRRSRGETAKNATEMGMWLRPMTKGRVRSDRA